jgi:hypothetical protein
VTKELEGAELDHAVAFAEGENLPDYWRDPGDGSCWSRPGREVWSPSTRWDQGGQLIERERIELYPSYSEEAFEGWRAGVSIHGRVVYYLGPTPLIAAMRAFVASKGGRNA